jgi:hypothetical protein
VVGDLGRRHSDFVVPLVDLSFDDNADDSCAPNYAYDTAFRLLNSLSSDPARSWQCGGHGFDAPSLHPA